MQDSGGEGRFWVSSRVLFSFADVAVASNVVVSLTNCMDCTGVETKPPSESIRFHLTATIMSSGGIAYLPEPLVSVCGVS